MVCARTRSPVRICASPSGGRLAGSTSRAPRSICGARASRTGSPVTDRDTASACASSDRRGWPSAASARTRFSRAISRGWRSQPGSDPVSTDRRAKSGSDHRQPRRPESSLCHRGAGRWPGLAARRRRGRACDDRAATLRARDDLARALGVTARRRVTLRFHPTTDDYERVTGQRVVHVGRGRRTASCTCCRSPCCAIAACSIGRSATSSCT